jgi:lambda family phage portal protein
MNSWKIAQEKAAASRSGSGVPLIQPQQNTSGGAPKQGLPLRSRVHARMYAAGKADRFGTEWGSTPLTADQVVDRNQRILVARSREQSSNNDYAKSFLRMCRQNIVGPQGVQLQAQSRDDRGKLDTLANQAIEAGFEAWGNRKNCDVTGKRSWRAIQAGCVNSAVKDGEFMVRLIYGRDAGPWGFALQVLDPQRCPVDVNEERTGRDTFIKQGIEFNKYGRPLFYLFTTTDERESEYRFGGRNFVRVPADDIVHGFLEDMVGQKRGLPWMATGLFRMRHLNGMEDAAIINARVGASKMGFIQWKDGQRPDFLDDLDDDEVQEMLSIDAEAGTFPVLPEGAELHEWNPQYPAGEFAPFYKTMLRGIAAGFGVLYNNLSSDLEGVNFSSIRQGTLDEREHWKDLQEWLVESLIQPVFEAWLPRALLGGKLTVRGRPLKPERIDRYSAVAWQPRRWQWIDPRADVDAAVDSKNNMLTSPSAIIREQGKDPATLWAETARDIRAMIDAMVAEGINEKDATELVMLSMGKQPQKPAPAPSGAPQNAKE